MISQFLYTILAALLSIAALFVSTKIIGNKQMSQMNMFDYINGITIGSIAAEMAVDRDHDVQALIAIGIYTLVLYLISKISEKNIAARRFLTGKSILLMKNGKMLEQNFRMGKIDLNEFLTQCRISGFFDVGEIDTAVLEQNGRISFHPKPNKRPATPADLAVQVPEEKLPMAVIIDGEIMEKNLKMCGYNHEWLDKHLKKINIRPDEVFLAMCDDDLTIFKKGSAHASQNDVFQ